MAKKTTTSPKVATKKATPAKKDVAVKAATIKKVAAKKTTPVKKSTAKKAATTKKVVTKNTVTVKKTVAKKNTSAKKDVIKKTTTVKKDVAKKVAVKKTAPKTNKSSLKNITTKKVAPTKKATSAKKSVQPAKNNSATKKTAQPKRKPATKSNSATPILAKPAIQRKQLITNAGNSAKFAANYNRADMFYKNTLKATIEKRYLKNVPEDAAFYKKHIDLTIKKDNRSVTIIEKSRDQDWNELYLEIYSDYPNEKGWVFKSEAEYLAYFFPGRVWYTKLEPIKNFCESIFSKMECSGIFKDLMYQYPNASGKLSKAIKINVKTYSLNFYKVYSEIDGKPVHKMGLIMSPVLLKDFHIDIKSFRQ